METIQTSGRLPRHTLRVPCQVVRFRDFRLIADRVENASLTGLLVTPAEPVLTGEKLIVSFAIPDGSGWVDAEAVVTRVIHGRRPGENCRALGLAFEQIDEQAQWVLARHLQCVPWAPPGRSHRKKSNAAVVRTLAWFSGRHRPLLAN